MSLGRFIVGLLAVALVCPIAGAAEPQAKVATPISYYRQVRPIFQQHCQGCHQPAKALGGYVMTSFADLLKKGESDKAGVVPGKPEASELLIQIMPHGDKAPKMPKGRAPLVSRDVATIATWITEGAKDDTPASERLVVDADHPPTYVLPPVITAIDFSPDGQLLAVSGYHEVLLHKADGSALVARLVGLSERVQSLAFSPDGQLLAVAGGSPSRFGEVQVWDVKSKKLKLSQAMTYDTLYGISWSPDGTKLAFGCADNTVRAIEAATGKQVLYQGAHSDWVMDTVFSHTGTHVVSVSRDRSMKLTELATQRFIDNVSSITPGALKGGLIAVARHPHKDELLIGGADGTPKIYQMFRAKKRVIGDDFNFIKAFDTLPGRIFTVAYDPHGTRIAAGTSNEGKGEVRVWESASKPDERSMILCGLVARPYRGLANLLFASDFLYKGKPICNLAGQKGPVYTVVFRPDGKVIASAGYDGVVRFNDATTGALIKEFVPVPQGARAGR
jgi:WD40 repeat protein